jgi:hypothetical protein
MVSTMQQLLLLCETSSSSSSSYILLSTLALQLRRRRRNPTHSNHPWIEAHPSPCLSPPPPKKAQNLIFVFFCFLLSERLAVFAIWRLQRD